MLLYSVAQRTLPHVFGNFIVNIVLSLLESNSKFTVKTLLN